MCKDEHGSMEANGTKLSGMESAQIAIVYKSTLLEGCRKDLVTYTVMLGLPCKCGLGMQ